MLVCDSISQRLKYVKHITINWPKMQTKEKYVFGDFRMSQDTYKRQNELEFSVCHPVFL